MRGAAFAAVSVCVLLAACKAEAAPLRGGAASRLPGFVRSSLSAFAEAVAAGDRAAAASCLEASSRASAAPMIEELIPGPRQPWTEVDLRVVGASVEPDGTSLGRAILLARVAPAPAAGGPRSPEEGSPRPAAALRPEAGLRAVGLSFRMASKGSLELELGSPASVISARLDFRAEPERERVSVRSELELAAEAEGLESVLLEVPPGTDHLELLAGPFASGRWLQAGAEGGGGQLLLELVSSAGEGPHALSLRHEAAVTDGMKAGGSTLYLPYGAMIAPWAGERFHLWDVVLDVPQSLQAVSIGRSESLEAPAGRRRVRYSTERAIDYPAVAVGPFRVDRSGPLELWRRAEVGGDPSSMLAELSELVAFHEERVGELPYGAFRLVELDMPFASAVSYASVIFMKTAVMATAKQRLAILSHEVAHQWWGNAVQGDRHTRWISEGMANALMDLVVRDREGEEAMQDLLDGHRANTLQSLGPGARPLADVRGRPADFYDRGALFVHALREAVGDETFWAILSAWYLEHSGPGVSTLQLRRTAERVAGRGLDVVFDPWLGSTALPWLDMDWAHEGETLRLELRQEEPAFSLSVVVEALLRGGRSERRTFRIDGPLSRFEWALPERPLALRLDPEQRTPRVREAERGAYLLGEGGACLARGLTQRGLALLERYEASHGLLPHEAASWRSAALTVERGQSSVDESLLPILGTSSSDEGAMLLLAHADRLLETGAAELALPLLQELSESVEDGAAVALRLGQAHRQLGQLAEAGAAWRLAHERRPANAAARLALGLPAADEQPETWRTLVDPEDRRLDLDGPQSSRLFSASLGRWGLALSGARRIWTGRGEQLEAVDAFTPSGLVSAVVVEPDAVRPLVVALEGGARRGRLTVLELDETGRGRVIASHSRLPGAALDLVAAGGSVQVAWPGRDESTQWFRFLPPLRGPGTEGPDDRDGLLNLAVDEDERFESSGTSPAGAAATWLDDGTLVWQAPSGALHSAEGPIWEELEPEGRWAVADLRPAGTGVALLLQGDRSRSPYPEDALPSARLVVISPEGLREHELPGDASQAVVLPGGDLLALSGGADGSCGGKRGVGKLRVVLRAAEGGAR